MATFGDNGWLVSGGLTTYLADDHSARGIAYDPARDFLYVASRTGGAGIHVIQASTGEHMHSLDMTGVEGGTFPINMVGVGTDGAVYACNLSTASTEVFAIYRWADGDPSTEPSAAFRGETGLGRTGDTFAVTAEGTGTRIVASGSGHRAVAVFDTLDGESFSLTAATPISGVASGGFRLGLDFMDRETVIGQQTGSSEVNVADLSSATGQRFWVRTIGEAPLAYYAPEQLLATVDITDNQVRLYQATDLPNLSSTGFLGSGNRTTAITGNPNGTGDLAFGVSSDGTLRLYAMNTNNGIQAFEIVSDPQGMVPRDLELSFQLNRSMNSPFYWTAHPRIRTTETGWALPIVVASPNEAFQGFINHPDRLLSRSIGLGHFNQLRAELTGTWTITIDSGGEHFSRYFFSVNADDLQVSRFPAFGVLFPAAGADLAGYQFYAKWTQPVAGTWDTLIYASYHLEPYRIERWSDLGPDETGYYPEVPPEPGNRRLTVIYRNEQGGFPEIQVGNPHFNLTPAPFAWRVGRHTSSCLLQRDFAINATPTPGFFEWVGEHFSPEERHNQNISGIQASPGGDGVSNLERYALGMAPGASDRSKLPVLTRAAPDDAGNPGRLMLTFRILAGDPALQYQVGTSSDLKAWNFDEMSEEIELEVTDHGDGTQTVRAFYPQEPDREHGFMRLLLSYD